MKRLGRGFYAADALEVAPRLLNKVLVSGACLGRIIEVEAYLQHDPASHSYRGPTPRCRTMFGLPGHLYVYLSYGIHHCVNVVTGTEADGQAVLVRAVQPLEGLDVMRSRRGDIPDAHLTDGPGKVGQAFGLDLRHDGVDLVHSDQVWLADDGVPPPPVPRRTPRVGISRGTEHLWRFLAAAV